LPFKTDEVLGFGETGKSSSLSYGEELGKSLINGGFHGKIMLKSWENHGKIHRNRWFTVLNFMVDLSMANCNK